LLIKNINMINQNELRIGSLIKYEDANWCVTEIVCPISNYTFSGYDIDVPEKKGLCHIISVEGANAIPITEEWLLKFGFRCKFEGGVYFGPQYEKHFEAAEKLIELAYDINSEHWFFNNWFPSDVHIKSVHQLQNIIFALTQTELIINP